jgi:hypothetical protein
MRNPTQGNYQARGCDREDSPRAAWSWGHHSHYGSVRPRLFVIVVAGYGVLGGGLVLLCLPVATAMGPSFSHELLGWSEVGCGGSPGPGGVVVDSLSIHESRREAGSRSVSSAFHLAIAHGIPPANPRTHNRNTEIDRGRVAVT